jgi:[ribosomal protein S5]-alanine N-acetyltransferase
MPNHPFNLLLGKNICLRPWVRGDEDALVKHANNFKIASYLTDAFPHPYTLQDAVSFLDKVIDQQPHQVFAIDLINEAIGAIGVFPQTGIHRKSAEIGYWLSELHWGKGFISESISLIIPYAFSTWDIHRLFARPFSNNPGSRKALEKTGFHLEAILKSSIMKNNQVLDECIYALIKSSFKI